MGIMLVFDDSQPFGLAKIKQKNQKTLMMFRLLLKAVFALMHFSRTSEILSCCLRSKCRRNF